MQYTGGQEDNTMYIVLGVVIVIILVGLFLMWPASSAPSPEEQPVVAPVPPPDYSFYPYMDSGKNDIKRVAALANKIDELKAECDSLANCVGFNTNAWLKNKIKPQNQWHKWTSDPNKGLYIKPGTVY